MYKLILSLSMLVVLSTCSKRMCGCDPVPPYFKATVIDTSNIDCKKPLLLFEDSTALASFIGRNESRYVVHGLPDSLKVQGKKVLVRVGIPAQDFNCTNIGPAYQRLNVFEAVGRN